MPDVHELRTSTGSHYDVADAYDVFITLPVVHCQLLRVRHVISDPPLPVSLSMDAQSTNRVSSGACRRPSGLTKRAPDLLFVSSTPSPPPPPPPTSLPPPATFITCYSNIPGMPREPKERLLFWTFLDQTRWASTFTCSSPPPHPLPPFPPSPSFKLWPKREGLLMPIKVV